MELYKDILRNEITKVKFVELTGSGENFASSIQALEITLQNGEVVHGVAKFFPKDQYSIKFGNSWVSFKNELVFYREILPALQAQSRQITDLFPTLLGGKLDKNEEKTIILLENLKEKHYEVCSSCDLETTKLVLQKLAQFHAASFAFRQNRPEEFQREVLSHLTEFKVRLINNEDMRCSAGAIEAIISEVRKDELCARNLEKIQTVLGKCAKTIKLPKNSPEISQGKFAALIHGDLWRSNIMVRGKDVKFLDWQMPQHASIAQDLIFFLFTSVEDNVLQKNLDDFLYFYFENFKAEVQLKCNTELNFNDFQEDVKEVASCFSYLDTLVALDAVFPGKNAVLRLVEQNPKDKLVFHFTEECKKRMLLVTHLFLRKNWI